MVSYNNGRFLFKFDLNDRKISAVYDSKYETEYIVGHRAFMQVFEKAVESLDDKAADELRIRLKNEPKYANRIAKILFKRKKH